MVRRPPREAWTAPPLRTHTLYEIEGVDRLTVVRCYGTNGFSSIGSAVTAAKAFCSALAPGGVVGLVAFTFDDVAGKPTIDAILAAVATRPRREVVAAWVRTPRGVVPFSPELWPAAYAGASVPELEQGLLAAVEELA